MSISALSHCMSKLYGPWYQALLLKVILVLVSHWCAPAPYLAWAKRLTSCTIGHTVLAAWFSAYAWLQAAPLMKVWLLTTPQRCLRVSCTQPGACTTSSSGKVQVPLHLHRKLLQKLLRHPLSILMTSDTAGGLKGMSNRCRA